ncbi:MAG: S8 family serine peptidase, partial [Anaerolineales bacterium]|nr:S8 family serine peptidase [Anaerolineales bacterium]
MMKRRSVSTLFIWLALALAVIPLALAAAREPQPAWHAKVDSWVLQRLAESDKTEALIYLSEQADLSGATALSDKVARGQYVFATLSALADETQASLRAELDAQNIPYRSYWIANMIWVELDSQQLAALASRADVAHVYANPTVALQLPAQPDPFAPLPDGPDTIEWNIDKINAPDVWQMGFDGTGVVVGGQDTGYEWEHPALKDKYRGWNGVTADHNYSWHDSIHSGGGSCGADSAEPCDDHDHGTHTMGTMVGDDGGSNQIGVAPGAAWIGCRNMDQGNGTPTTYSECFQWFVAPTDLNDENPNPAMAPDVINNSWGCPPSEGCTDPTILQTVVENTRAAGI